MARIRRNTKKTERHVVVCAFVVETPEGTDITSTDDGAVIPQLVGEIDEHFVGNGSAVKDVTMYTERGFMWEVRKHGFPSQFPDVWKNGPPKEMTVRKLRSSPRPKKKLKRKVTVNNETEAAR